jgi:hypothetical protein
MGLQQFARMEHYKRGERANEALRPATTAIVNAMPAILIATPDITGEKPQARACFRYFERMPQERSLAEIRFRGEDR